ncbi:hypothetical protein AWZ03_013612, partial [Drosophila navojoa]
MNGWIGGLKQIRFRSYSLFGFPIPIPIRPVNHLIALAYYLQECNANEYRCRNGKCIDNSKVCNYVVDCPDGEDEGDDCPAACSGMEYQCRDGTRCISVSQQCDGHADCSDADDEEQCDG